MKIDFVEMIFREKKFKVQKIFAENRENLGVPTLDQNPHIVSTYIYIYVYINIFECELTTIENNYLLSKASNWVSPVQFFISVV